ncbi:MULTISPECIES: hypothetical protein [Chryseobacterium]|uniref:hypothetical protein n=1 Tax=Chryseobacterium TaxID=59732 RepID=UPI001623ECCC|nr:MULTISPECIES: hypothetical protein [Chryseobacterium]MDM1554946.1 hypothetical protein [Chryseobacterium indologenes]
MKKLLVAFIILQTIFSCDKPATYSTKAECGLKGEVKQMTSYFCDVKDDKIPKDSTDYMIKCTKTFDNVGNALETNKIIRMDVSGSIQSCTYRGLFSGKGKSISYKDILTCDNNPGDESSYKYVWADNYHCTITPQNNSSYTTSITLDKNYLLIKSVLKNKDKLQITEELEYTSKNDKIQKIKSKITENRDGEILTRYLIQVSKNYDEHNNPTIAYIYDNVDERAIKQVVYNSYLYY